MWTPKLSIVSASPPYTHSGQAAEHDEGEWAHCADIFVLPFSYCLCGCPCAHFHTILHPYRFDLSGPWYVSRYVHVSCACMCLYTYACICFIPMINACTCTHVYSIHIHSLCTCTFICTYTNIPSAPYMCLITLAGGHHRRSACAGVLPMPRIATT